MNQIQQVKLILCKQNKIKFIKFNQNITYDDFIKTLRENKNIPYEEIKLNQSLNYRFRNNFIEEDESLETRTFVLNC